MIFAMVFGAADIRAHPLVYFAHVSNFHMAWMDGWPSGTAHYWTLAIQMQFYLLWPLLVFLMPRRWLGPAFGLCLVIAPLSRFVIGHWFPGIHHGEAISPSALDYFGAGALLALAMEQGLREGDHRMAAAGWLAFAGYVVLYSLNEAGRQVAGLCYFQQTLLAVAFAGLICSTLGGFGGRRRMLLDHPVVQHIGKLSYGLYLFHTPVPLFLGWVLPWLWKYPVFDGPLSGLRLAVFAIVSWAAAWLCWRWLEGPDRLRFPQWRRP
jgi:peptidoglycan/LPS O-acetylase OafA/YrhL